MTTPEDFISEFKRITLTPNERSAMRSRLHAYALSHAPMSGFFARSVQWFGQHSVAALISAVVLVGGATGVSAHFAGPSDALYGFRVNVNDRVQTALTLDEDKKLDTEMLQLQRMIDDEDGERDHELSDISESLESSQESEVTVDVGKDENEGEDKNENEDDDEDFDRELNELEQELKIEDSSRIELE